jgi:hypothetical protein
MSQNKSFLIYLFQVFCHTDGKITNTNIHKMWVIQDKSYELTSVYLEGFRTSLCVIENINAEWVVGGDGNQYSFGPLNLQWLLSILLEM